MNRLKKLLLELSASRRSSHAWPGRGRCWRKGALAFGRLTALLNTLGEEIILQEIRKFAEAKVFHSEFCTIGNLRSI